MMVDDASKPVVVDEALLDDLAEKAKAAELLAMQRRLLAVLQDPDHATLRAWVETVPPLVVAALVQEVRVRGKALESENERLRVDAERYRALEAAWQANQLMFTQGRGYRFTVGPGPGPYTQDSFSLQLIADEIRAALEAAKPAEGSKP